MTMMDYGSQFTGSIISCDTMSESVSSAQPRIRTVRLVRPCSGTLPPPGMTGRYGPNLGFSIRGGREHGTGFFVSIVEPGSEAHRQGLKVGDQVIRINGFAIEDAVHKEVLQLISNLTHLNLKVRSVGMIPFKERNTDSLSWQITSDCTSSTRSSPQLSDKIQDVRINILVAPRTKLGCGICKGPEWKPGIFVQFTKEGGIAREAGLRPGDQILYCNNIDFSDIQFNEAVNVMKTSRKLDLMVRKCAGSELFPGESSGYNSSASSVTGDQSPSWSDSKRLSIVKEESSELEDRLSQLDRLKSNNNKWDKNKWDSDCEYEGYQFKPTIINLSENGTIITNNGSEECQNIDTNTLTRNNASKLADICLVSRQQETKTVHVEVHRSNDDKKTENKLQLSKNPSISSFSSLASRSSDASSSLSSAISLELARRSERKKVVEAPKSTIDDQIQKQKILKGVNTDKQQQHSKLMDEFKKVHRKMFKANDEDEGEVKGTKLTNTNESGAIKKELVEREINRQYAANERRSPETLQNKTTKLGTLSDTSATLTPPPPPPPPGATNSSNKLNGLKPKTKIAPPVPVKYSTLSYKQESRPPPCPTPDYDNISINSNSTLAKAYTNRYAQKQTKTSQKNDVVEMESLESFKLNNPSKYPPPKPPNTYFNKIQTNGEKKQRPVSVTIGQYPSGSLRKQPGKLDFLQNGYDEHGTNGDDSINTKLASELAYALNRSNLKRRTESMENLLNGPHIKPQSNGSVTISLNNGLGHEDLNEKKSNRVTINITSAGDKKSGILKNGNGNHNLHNTHHKSLVHQKSITFGEM